MKSIKMPSTMRGGHAFSQVPRADIPRSQFNRDHGLKTTFNAGYLVPIYVDEALPGDTFRLRASAFVRLATPVKPIMDNLHLELFFFAIPYRLVWSNFVKMMGERVDPDDDIDYTVPQCTVPSGGYQAESLEDYLMLPVAVDKTTTAWTHSALPRRAYFRVWNEWFRDQNLQDTRTEGTAVSDGPDSTGAGGTALLKRGKRHDYFTSCLPWPQKGTAVSLPLGTSAPVVSSGTGIPTFWDNSSSPQEFHFQAGASGDSGAVNFDQPAGNVDISSASTFYWKEPELEADLSSATAATINALRQAFQVQKLLERDARGGTRYIEIIKSHFGVTSPDARLQRTEYLGGGHAAISVNPVQQTSSTDVTTPQGNLSGVGTGFLSGSGFVKSFTEHTILLGLACVRADLTYQEGLDRMYSRETRYDFYWPALANLGEQVVYNREIYIQDHADDAEAFGYQERYAEYRYKPSRITGKFRSNHANTLDVWHLSQEFGSLPTLGATFIVESPPMTRVKAVTSEPDFLGDFWFDLKCARPMPMYSVPGLIDHF